MKMKCSLSSFVIRICTLFEYQPLYKIKIAISVKYQIYLAVITLKYMYKYLHEQNQYYCFEVTSV